MMRLGDLSTKRRGNQRNRASEGDPAGKLGKSSPSGVRRAIFGAPWLTTLAVGSCLFAAVPPNRCFAEDLAEGVSLRTFDFAWQRIAETYWDPGMDGVDWDAARDELRPEAARARSNSQLRPVLERMIARLGQSHFGILSGDDEEVAEESPREDGDDAAGACPRALRRHVVALLSENKVASGSPGISISAVHGEWLVARLEAGSAAAEQGVALGWRVDEVAGIPLSSVGACVATDDDPRSHLVGRAVEALLGGEPDSTVAVRFSDGLGRAKELELERRRSSEVTTAKLGNLPALEVRFHRDWRWTPQERHVTVVQFNYWMLPVAELMDNAMPELQEAEGIIIDLRGNLGGVAGLSVGVAGYFLSEQASLGTLKYRNGELSLNTQPRLVTRGGQSLRTFLGPLAVLIDGQSASTSEIFAAGLQDHGRARLFGATSMGAALPAVIEPLPNGDFLMHAMADLLRPNGGRIEGHGVVPDEVVELDRESLLRGTDRVVEAALSWIDLEVSRAAESASPAGGAGPRGFR